MPKKYTTQLISVGLGLLLIISLTGGIDAYGPSDKVIALDRAFSWIHDFVATVVGNAMTMAVRNLFPSSPPKQEPPLGTDKKTPSLTTRTFEWPDKDGTVALLSNILCGGKPCPIIQHQAERRTTAERVWNWVTSFMPPYAMSANRRMLMSLASLNLALLAMDD